MGKHRTDFENDSLMVKYEGGQKVRVPKKHRINSLRRRSRASEKRNWKAAVVNHM